MKILRLDLRAFGPFTEASVELSAGREGLHFVYGPNEAGKSSTLRALRQMLFGIDQQTDDDFVHPYKELRVGGSLRSRSGKELSFLRVKRQKRTLRTPDGDELDDAALDEFLGGIDARRFRTFFGIDHEELVKGGEAILRGDGDVGELVFGSGTDLNALSEFRKSLEARSVELFKPRGELPTLNKSIREFEAARRDIEAASLRSSEWRDLTERLEDLSRSRADLESQLADLDRRRSRFERIQQALPDVSRLHELRALLEEHSDARCLRDNFAEERRGLEDIRRLATRTLEVSRAELQEVESNLAELPEADPTLAHAGSIETLVPLVGLYRDAGRALAALHADRQAQETVALSRAHELGLDPRTISADAIKITLQARQRIKALSSSYLEITVDLDRSARRLDQLGLSIQEIEGQLAALPPVPDAEGLRLVLRRVQGCGDLDQKVAELRNRFEERREASDIEARRLVPGGVPCGGVEAMPVPPLETIEWHRSEIERSSRLMDELRHRLGEAREELIQIESDLERLRSGGEVPREEDLRASRARRDLLWRLVKARLTGDQGEAGPRPTISAPGGSDLHASFESSLVKADELADRLRLEANRAAELAGLEMERRRVTARIQERAGRLEDQEGEHQRRHRQWSSAWAGCGVEPKSPAEMLTWTREYLRFQEGRAQLREVQRTLRDAESEAGRARGDLERELGRLGSHATNSSISVSALVDRALAIIGTIEDARARHREVTESRRLALEQMAEAREEGADARRRYDAWRAQWAQALEPLGIDADAGVEEVASILEGYSALRDALQRRETLDTEIHRLESEREDFASRVYCILDGVDPNDERTEPADALDRLASRLNAAREIESRRGERRSRADRLLATIREATLERGTALDRLAALAEEAGVEDPGMLSDAERKSAEIRDAEEEIRQVESRLRINAAGHPLPEFLAEAAEIDADALPGELERLLGLASGLREQIQQHDQSIGEVRQTLAMMEETARDARANEAAARAQELLVKIESNTSRYVRLRLASAMLKEAIERYREQSQGPVLRDASSLFARLTCGSFEGLTTRYEDDGRGVLVGIRAGGEQVVVRGMSTGSRDQLYLALKLASLHDYLDHHDPMPLIVDDILVHYDDDRARQALLVLAEISRKTQVLFFTHHRHLMELAEASLSPDVLLVHELQSPRVAVGR